MMQEYFDPEVLRTIETLSHSEANQLCIELIEGTKTKSSKKAHLIKDINEAPDPREMSRIMYNTMLSGMGLATMGSAWQKLHS